MIMTIYSLFFFVSSRRRHTRFSRDWSSDVCSSDLTRLRVGDDPGAHTQVRAPVRDRERADGDVEIARVALGVDPAHRPAVDVPRHRLEILDDLHDARLGRTRHRGRWERRPHELADPGTGAPPPAHGAHEMVEAGMGLQLT